MKEPRKEDEPPIPNPGANGGIELLKWRVAQLESWRERHEAEVERRRVQVDADMEELKGNMSATIHRLDMLFLKITIWGTIVAAVVGFIVEHFLPRLFR